MVEGGGVDEDVLMVTSKSQSRSGGVVCLMMSEDGQQGWESRAVAGMVDILLSRTMTTTTWRRRDDESQWPRGGWEY